MPDASDVGVEVSATRGVLFVAGGEDVMRQTFREQGRAYWSAEFAVILEKHGWLDFDTASPDALKDASRLDGYGLVIVAWLPEDAWRAEYAATLEAFDGLVLLEGPFPGPVEEMLGVRRCGEPVVGARGPLSFSREARAYIEQRFGKSFPIGHRSAPDPSLEIAASGKPRPLELSPREAITRRSGISRNAYFELEAEPFESNVGRAAISLTLAYRARFANGRQFFDDPVEDALALLACVRCLAALTGEGPLRDELRRLVRDAAGSNRPPIRLAGEQTALARAIWGVALAEASVALRDSTFAERAKDVVGDVRLEWELRRAPDPLLSRWRTLLALRLTDLSAASGGAAARLEALLLDRASSPSPAEAWLDTTIGDCLHSVPAEAPTSHETWLAEIGAALCGSTGVALPLALNGFTLPELMLLMGALAQVDQLAAARRLWRVLIEALYDTRQGLFMGARVVDKRLVPTMSFAVTPYVALGLLDAAAPIDLVAGPARALAGYSDEQLAAWAATPYTLQPYAPEPELDAVAIEIAQDGASLPVLWRRGNLIATSVQLLAQLVHVHTVEPLAEPFMAFRSGDAIALEYLLLHLLDLALAERGSRTVQVGPWPWGISYGLTVRHDVDRVLDEGQFERLLEFENNHDLAVSWFWLPDRLEPEQLARLDREPNHEVALHAIWLDQKREELGAVGRAVATPIVGEALHGAGDSWLGHLSVRAAVETGLLYTELAPPIADCPYARYPVVDAGGVVSSERIIGVTYNISIEGMLGVKPGSEGGPHLYRQLLNHPDMNFDRLENWVRALPEEPRVAWTCEQVARWWKATHAEGGLSVRHLQVDGDGAAEFELTAPTALSDVELRIPCRPEAISEVSIDGKPAEWAPLDGPEGPGIRVRMSLEPHAARILEVHGRPAFDKARGTRSDSTVSAYIRAD